MATRILFAEDALLLLKCIGLPGVIKGQTPPFNRTLQLLRLAEQNKVPLPFLESIAENRNFENQLSSYRDRHRRTLDLARVVSSLFEGSHIDYAIFKTIKPYPNTPADIDILTLSSLDLKCAIEVLKNKGFKSLDKDLHGSTMLSANHDLNVDLTREVAVSSFIYLDKKLLFKHAAPYKMGDFFVQSLSPPADLVVVAAHCLYKEQMFLLSDYYTFALSSKYYKQALEIAKNAHAKFALETALQLTYNVTVNAFGADNSIVEKLKCSLTGVDCKLPVASKPVSLPMKYPIRILQRGFLEKINDPVAQRSMFAAFSSVFQPAFVNKLFKHVQRKSY